MKMSKDFFICVFFLLLSLQTCSARLHSPCRWTLTDLYSFIWYLTSYCIDFKFVNIFNNFHRREIPHLFVAERAHCVQCIVRYLASPEVFRQKQFTGELHIVCKGTKNCQNKSTCSGRRTHFDLLYSLWFLVQLTWFCICLICLFGCKETKKKKREKKNAKIYSKPNKIEIPFLPFLFRLFMVFYCSCFSKYAIMKLAITEMICGKFRTVVLQRAKDHVQRIVDEQKKKKRKYVRISTFCSSKKTHRILKNPNQTNVCNRQIVPRNEQLLAEYFEEAQHSIETIINQINLNWREKKKEKKSILMLCEPYTRNNAGRHR